MAVGYEIVGESTVSVHIPESEVTDRNGDVIGFYHIAEPHLPGDVIPEERMSPTVIGLYNSGDTHTLSIFKRVTIGSDTTKAVSTGAKSSKKTPVKEQSAEE